MESPAFRGAGASLSEKGSADLELAQILRLGPLSWPNSNIPSTFLLHSFAERFWLCSQEILHQTGEGVLLLFIRELSQQRLI